MFAIKGIAGCCHTPFMALKVKCQVLPSVPLVDGFAIALPAGRSSVFSVNMTARDGVCWWLIAHISAVSVHPTLDSQQGSTMGKGKDGRTPSREQAEEEAV